MPVNVVAIDGPAGSGKSTVARRVAEKLGFTHVDTGAMYRALTLKAIKGGVSIEDENVVYRIVSGAELDLEDGRVFLDNQDVTAEIRSGKVTRHVATVSAYPSIRGVLLSRQRAFAQKHPGIVMEGRDIGSVVFPDARWKFYLDAKPEVRAQRRQAELAAMGRPKDINIVLGDILQRDKEDQEREAAPLRKPEDASVIDTSPLTIDEVVAKIVAVVDKAKGAKKDA